MPGRGYELNRPVSQTCFHALAGFPYISQIQRSPAISCWALFVFAVVCRRPRERFASPATETGVARDAIDLGAIAVERREARAAARQRGGNLVAAGVAQAHWIEKRDRQGGRLPLSRHEPRLGRHHRRIHAAQCESRERHIEAEE